MEHCIDNQIQYIGLKSYSENQRNIFWGRKKESEEITNSIYSNNSTIIFGPSGSGKTSLINAGVIPKLRETQYIPIKVTPKSCTLDGKLQLWETISRKIDESVEKFTLQNNPLKKITKNSLYEKLFNYSYEDEFGFNIYFSIIIDQFEEVFQLGLNLKEIQSIFDVYEELCGYSQKNKTDRFLQEKIPSYHRFVLIVRQDYMFEVESNAYRYPLLYKNRICINHLNEEQAFEIITSSTNSSKEKRFSSDDAVNIIKEITNRSDFKIDNVPEIEVDSMMLSLYMFLLCIRQLEQKTKVPIFSVDDIVKDFYMDNMNIENIEIIEKQLMSSDGRHRKPVLYTDCLSILSEDEIEKLVYNGIIELFHNSGVDWIRLRHDKLCRYAMMHIQASSNKKIVIQQSKPTKFLNPDFRISHINSFSSFTKESPENNNFSQLLFFLQNKLSNLSNNILGENIESQNSKYLIDIKSFDKKGNLQEQIDGVDKMRVSLTNGKLYSISFYRDSKPHSLYFGVHEIVIYYDSLNRPVLYDYRDTDGNRTVIEDGYTSILFSYDDVNQVLPNKTYYLNIHPNLNIISSFGSPKLSLFTHKALAFKTMHVDGNFGYYSEYKNCCEIERTFFDENEKEVVLNDGYSSIHFEKDETNTLLSISFYKFRKKCRAIEQDFHKLELTYNSNKSLITSMFYKDEQYNPCSDEENSYGVINRLRDNFLFQIKTNKHHKFYANKYGILCQCIMFNNNQQLEWISHLSQTFDTVESPSFGNKASSLLYYNLNNKLEWSFDFDKNNNIVEVIYFQYDQKMRINRITYYDGNLNIMKTQEIERVADKEKITTYNVTGSFNNENKHILSDESFERKKINANTYLLDDNSGKKYVEIKDSQGNTIVTYLCNDEIQHIEDDNHVWERRYEYQNGIITKEYAVNIDNCLVEIDDNIYGFEYEYQNSDIDKKIYFLDKDGNRNLYYVKYEKSSLWPDSIDYEYINEQDNSKTNEVKTNISKFISKKYGDDQDNYGIVQGFYDINDNLCNCESGWSYRELIWGKSIKYFDSDSKPVNGPNGWHQFLTEEVISGVDNSHIYLNKDGNPVKGELGYAAFAIQKVGFKEKIGLALKNSSLTFLTFNPLYKAVFYDENGNYINDENTNSFLYKISEEQCRDFKYSLNPQTLEAKLLDIKFGNNISESTHRHSCIIIKEAVDNYLGFKSRDVIITLGDWNTFDYYSAGSSKTKKSDRDTLVNDFDKSFTNIVKKERNVPITYARYEDGKWKVMFINVQFSKDKAKIGKLGDADITFKDYDQIFNVIEEQKKYQDKTIKKIAAQAIKRAKELSALQIECFRKEIKQESETNLDK